MAIVSGPICQQPSTPLGFTGQTISSSGLSVVTVARSMPKGRGSPQRSSFPVSFSTYIGKNDLCRSARVSCEPCRLIGRQRGVPEDDFFPVLHSSVKTRLEAAAVPISRMKRYSLVLANWPPLGTPLGLTMVDTICIFASGNICSSNRPSRKYSFSSIATIRTDSSGFSSFLASRSLPSIIVSHLL